MVSVEVGIQTLPTQMNKWIFFKWKMYYFRLIGGEFVDKINSQSNKSSFYPQYLKHNSAKQIHSATHDADSNQPFVKQTNQLHSERNNIVIPINRKYYLYHMFS